MRTRPGDQAQHEEGTVDLLLKLKEKGKAIDWLAGGVSGLMRNSSLTYQRTTSGLARR